MCYFFSRLALYVLLCVCVSKVFHLVVPLIFVITENKIQEERTVQVQENSNVPHNKRAANHEIEESLHLVWFKASAISDNISHTFVQCEITYICVYMSCSFFFLLLLSVSLAHFDYIGAGSHRWLIYICITRQLKT